MHVIRHHDPFIELHTGANERCPFPLLVDDASERGENGCLALHPAKCAALLERTDRHEVGRAAVEELWQPDASAVGLGHRAERTSEARSRGRTLCAPTDPV